MIHIYYTQFTAPLPDPIWSRLIAPLPEKIKQKITKYIRWQDQTACLLGKRLLLEALTKHGFDENCLSDLRFTEYSRPYLDWPGDFNLSHSGEYVVCVISNCFRVGIDVEQHRDINFKDFQQYMLEEEWNKIQHSNNSHATFFDLWTAKESIIKADGRGFSAPLKEIKMQNGSATLSEMTWRLKQHSFDSHHSCCIASNTDNFSLEFNRIDYTER